MLKSSQKSNTKASLRLNEEGITLISLIICIIILIVLASVLINVSLDNVRIVDTAADSSKLYAIEQYQGTIEEGMQKEILEEAVLRRECNTKYCKRAD